MTDHRKDAETRARDWLSDRLFELDPMCGQSDCDSTARKLAPELVLFAASESEAAYQRGLADAAKVADDGAHFQVFEDRRGFVRATARDIAAAIRALTTTQDQTNG